MLDLVWVIIGFSFLVGAVFGSFITALLYRTNQGRSMREKHSICPHCHHELGTLDLLPLLSYCLLRGKCRYCHKPISIEYFCIELGTALLFAASAWLIWQHALQSLLLFGSNQNLLWVLLCIAVVWTVMVLLVSLFVYDLHWGELPNQWTLGGSVFITLCTIIALLIHSPFLWQPTYPAATFQALIATGLSGLIAGLFFLIIVVASEKILHKPGMGMGDVKLALLLGFFLGFPGIVVALYLAFVFGAVISLLLIAGKRQRFGNAIPFGPFMVAGAVAALWVTPAIIDWYNQFWL